jgi:membrane-associated phospholipid phosphatase
LQGNPFAAMPSLHFGTSVMAARVLSGVGPRQGAVGWTYALTLGFGLVYLGEHYLIDLIAGLALAEGIWRLAPRFEAPARAAAGMLQRLEYRAAG